MAATRSGMNNKGGENVREIKLQIREETGIETDMNRQREKESNDERQRERR
jgi:hypothetical protein